MVGSSNDFSVMLLDHSRITGVMGPPLDMDHDESILRQQTKKAVVLS